MEQFTHGSDSGDDSFECLDNGMEKLANLLPLALKEMKETMDINQALTNKAIIGLKMAMEMNQAQTAKVLDNADKVCTQLQISVRGLNNEVTKLVNQAIAKKKNDDGDDGGTVTQTMKKNLEASITVSEQDLRRDVIGHEAAKEVLRYVSQYPWTRPNVFQGPDAGPPRSVLLYGPTGTGKTTLAMWAVQNAGKKFTFLSVKPSDINSKYVGQAEGLVEHIFQYARAHTPCIIFIDEIDFILGKRKEGGKDTMMSLKAGLLQQLPPKDKDVCVIGATNFPGDLDKAFLRRFDEKVHIRLPTQKHKLEQLTALFNMGKHSLATKDLEYLAQKMEDMSQGQIETWVKRVFRNSSNRTIYPKFVMPDPKQGLWVACDNKVSGGRKVKDVKDDKKIKDFDVTKLGFTYVTRRDCDLTPMTERIPTSVLFRNENFEENMGAGQE